MEAPPVLDVFVDDELPVRPVLLFRPVSVEYVLSEPPLFCSQATRAAAANAITINFFMATPLVTIELPSTLPECGRLT